MYGQLRSDRVSQSWEHSREPKTKHQGAQRRVIIRRSLAVAFLALTGLAHSSVIRVSLGGSDAYDGSSWVNAKRSVGGALSAASQGDEIWVAEGLYPERINLREGVALFGGFAGNENARDQRDVAIHTTTLDGEDGGVVVRATGVSSSSCIDGFTITNGYAFGFLEGGGIFCSNASPVIANNTIVGNYGAQYSTGGIICVSSSPTISNNIIADNTSNYQSGGIGVYYNGCTPQIIGNTIRNNVGSFSGGGIYVSFANPLIIGNVIDRNHAFAGGGGIACYQSQAIIANNLIIGNYSESPISDPAGGGAGLICRASNLYVVNNTFVSNTAPPGQGGAIGVTDYCQPTIGNNIFDRNSSAVSFQNSSAVGGNNCLNGNGEGDGALLPGDFAADPMFVNSAEGDYHLHSTSPCIDAGDSGLLALVLPLSSTDLGGGARIVGGAVDVGAYEADRDLVAPIIVVSSPMDGGLYPFGSTLVVSFDVTDDASGVASVEALLNGTPVTSGQIVTLLQEGANELTVTGTDVAGNTSTKSVAFTVNRLLNELGDAGIWLGLKNSDDVGTSFDLQADVVVNGNLVASGQLLEVPGGSSGFNNASLRTIPLTFSGPAVIHTGDSLSVTFSVRVSAGSRHRSGTARLWFNDSAANSSFEATIDGNPIANYLLAGYLLGTSPGVGPKKTVDVTVDRAVGGNPFRPFGTWSRTIQ